MKYIISERQYKLLTEDEDRKILKLPSVDVFGDWEGLQAYLDKKGNPLFSISGDLDYFKLKGVTSLDNLVSVEGDVDLRFSDIESLGELKSVGGKLFLPGYMESIGNIQYVGGDVDLIQSNIKSLGDLRFVGGDLDIYGTEVESLGNLESVGGYLDLGNTDVKSLGKLKKVGGYLKFKNTPLSQMYSEKEIRRMVDVGDFISM